MERTVKIKSKNAILELLQANHTFEKIMMAEDIFKDDKVKEILEIAHERQIPVSKLPRKKLKKKDKDNDDRPLIAVLVAGRDWALSNLLETIYARNEDPFFLILNNIRYGQNAGAILRTAFASGVNGVLTSSKRESFLSEDVLHASMGTALRVPIVETNLFEAIKKLEKDGVKIFSLDMGGKPYFNEDLTGPVAFILGAEDTGVSSKISSRSDTIISIPMQEGIDSINVSVSAGIVMYEKIRQEHFGRKSN